MTEAMVHAWLICAIGFVPVFEFALRGVYGTEVAQSFACGVLQVGTLSALLLARRAGWVFAGGASGWWVAGIAASLAISAVFSDDGWFGFPALGNITAMILIFTLTSSLPAEKRKDGGRAIAMGLLVGGALAAGWAIWQMFDPASDFKATLQGLREWAPELARMIYARAPVERSFSFFIYPNILAGYLLLALPVALSVGLNAWHQRRLRVATVCAILVVVLVTAFVGAKSMGAVTSLFIALVLVPVRRHGRAAAICAVVLAVVILVMRSPLSFTAGVEAKWNHWVGAVSSMTSVPDLMVGMGPGLYGMSVGRQLAEGVRSRFAHNWLVETFAEGGIVGLAVLGGFLFFLVRVVRNRASRISDPWTRGLGVAWVAWGIHALVDIGYAIPSLAFPWWAVSGYLASTAGERKKVRVRSLKLNGVRRFVLSGVIVLGVALVPLFRGAPAELVYSLVLAAATAIAIAVFMIAPRQMGMILRKDVAWLSLLTAGFIWVGFSSGPGRTYPVVIEGAGLFAVMLLSRLLCRTSGVRGPSWVRLGILGSVCFYGLWGISGALDGQGPARASFPSPNMFAGFLLGGMGLALGSMTGRLSERVAGFGALAIAGTAVLATRSSGAWMAGGFLAAAWIGRQSFFSRRFRGLGMVAAAAVVSAGVVVAIPATDSLSVSQRLTMWKEGAKLLASRPLGVGPGMYGTSVAGVREPSVTAAGVGRYSLHARFAHNEPIQFASEWGLPFLGLLILGLIGLLVSGKGGVGDGWRWTIAAILLYSLVDFPLRAPPCKLLVAVAAGMITVSISARGRSERRRRNETVQLSPGPVLGATLALLIATAVARPALSRWILERDGEWRGASLAAALRAVAVYPANPEALEVEGVRHWHRWRFARQNMDAWRARETLGTALFLNGGDQDTGLSLGYFLMEFAGIRKKERFLEAARATFMEVAMRSPTSPHPWLGVARTFLAQRSWIEAEGALREALIREPFYLPAMAEKGRMKELEGKREEARRIYRAVLVMRAELLQRKRMNAYEERLCAINEEAVKGSLLDLGSGR